MTENSSHVVTLQKIYKTIFLDEYVVILILVFVHLVVLRFTLISSSRAGTGQSVQSQICELSFKVFILTVI